jgi:hypothetical protein
VNPKNAAIVPVGATWGTAADPYADQDFFG